MRRALKNKRDFTPFADDTSLSEEESKKVFHNLVHGRIWNISADDILTSNKDKSAKADSYINIANNTNQHRDSPVVWYPFKLHRQTRFESLQKWRGVVLEVSDEYFLARLVDMESPAPDEEAEILKREISDEDLQLIELGAVFYWNIGYQVDPSGQRKRASVIRFRRLPIWMPKELSDAKRWAENTLSRLNIIE